MYQFSVTKLQASIEEIRDHLQAFRFDCRQIAKRDKAISGLYPKHSLKNILRHLHTNKCPFPGRSCQSTCERIWPEIRHMCPCHVTSHCLDPSETPKLTLTQIKKDVTYIIKEGKLPYEKLYKEHPHG